VFKTRFIKRPAWGNPTAANSFTLDKRKGLGMRACLAVLICALSIVSIAQARDLEGRYAQSDPRIKGWIEGLTDKNGTSCCDTADGHEVEGWDMGPAGYRVKVQGRWLEVPPEALIEGPNLLGYARAWLRYQNGEPRVRCFIGGAGG
jgi:hypothetical protein